VPSCSPATRAFSTSFSLSNPPPASPYYPERPPIHSSLRNTAPKMKLYDPPPNKVVAYFNDAFHPLRFPEELALRIVTSRSYAGPLSNHNERLAFLGASECHPQSD
jgi:hypothetical protein